MFEQLVSSYYIPSSPKWISHWQKSDSCPAPGLPGVASGEGDDLPVRGGGHHGLHGAQDDGLCRADGTRGQIYIEYFIIYYILWGGSREI